MGDPVWFPRRTSPILIDRIGQGKRRRMEPGRRATTGGTTSTRLQRGLLAQENNAYALAISLTPDPNDERASLATRLAGRASIGWSGYKIED